MTTVIDALVVTLQIDPEEYKRGAAEAVAAQKALKDALAKSTVMGTAEANKASTNVKRVGGERKKQDDEERKRRRLREKEEKRSHDDETKRNDESISKLKSLGLAAAGAVLGFNTIKGAIEAYANASSQLANLGRLAPTVGASVKELDTLGDAYKQVGGKADDAGADIAKLAHAQFSYAVNAPDAMAGWMRRLGVNPFDDKGNPRDKLALQEDIARAIKSRTGDLQTQAMYAREMGMSEAFIQLYLMKSNAERTGILDKAAKTAKATEAGAKAAAAQDAALSRVKNNLKGAGESIVQGLAPAVTRVANVAANLMEGNEHTLARLGLPTVGLESAGGSQYSAKAAPFRAAFAAAEKKHHLPQGLLAAVAHRESNFNPNAVNAKSGARGLMQLMPNLFPNAGKNANADIETAAAELEARIKYRRSLGFRQGEALRLALADYNNGVGKNNKLIKSGGQLPAETRAYVPAVTDYAGFSSNATTPTAGGTGGAGGKGGTVNNITTRVDKVEVHTQATDADGIAATLPAAMERQGVVAQANSGMN